MLSVWKFSFSRNASLLFLLGLGLYRIGTWPAPMPESPEKYQSLGFPFEKSYRHLETLSKEIHPVGSKAHDEVLAYLVREIEAMGYQTRIQTAFVESPKTYMTRYFWLKNLIVEVPGKLPGPAALFVAHYDSAFNSYGANDDGSGVAALLGTLAAIKDQPLARNRRIFLFTDGEEMGLLGAQAFLEEDPQNIAVVANFEARGRSGAALLFETSPGNHALVKAWSRVSPFPMGTSAAYEIYRMMENDTDLTLFKKKGIAGLNFAYIDDPSRYHTQLDRFDQVDKRSLLHHGLNALALAKLLGDADLHELSNTSGDNRIYFNIFSAFFSYPQIYVLPFTLFLSLLFSWLLLQGIRKNQLELSAIFKSFLWIAGSMILVCLSCGLLWRVVVFLQPQYEQMSQGQPYESRPFMHAFAIWSLTSFLFFMQKGLQKLGMRNLLFASACFWLAPLLTSSLLAPGMSYLFAWPLLALGLGLALALHFDDQKLASVAGLCCGALLLLPAALVFMPMIVAFLQAMPTRMIAADMFLLLMVFALGLPLIAALGNFSRWRLLLVGSGAFVLSLGWAFYANRTSPERPSFNSLIHVTQANTGKSFWVSSMGLDAWSASYLTHPEKRPGSALSPLSKDEVLVSPAPERTVLPPKLEILEDEMVGFHRNLKMRVLSPRGARQLLLVFEPDVDFLYCQIDKFSPSNHRIGFFNLPPEGQVIELALLTQHALKIELVDIDQGFPAELGVKPRPIDRISSYKSSMYQDNNLVLASQVIDGIEAMEEREDLDSSPLIFHDLEPISDLEPLPRLP